MTSVAAQVFSRASLAHAISGCAGGALAMVMLYPLDQLRLSAQLSAITTSEEKQTGPTLLGPPAGAGMVARAAWIIRNQGFMELYVRRTHQRAVSSCTRVV